MLSECNADEIKVVFDDLPKLEKICDQIVGKLITGFNIIENQTSYIWAGELERKLNFVASTITLPEITPVVFEYFDKKIKESWEVPLIQVVPCIVGPDFQKYLQEETEKFQVLVRNY